MNKRFLAFISGCALCVPALSFACSEPDSRPTIPDPATAVTAQMVKASHEVKAFVQAMEEYLGCARVSPSEHGRKLTELREFTEEFNLAIREYKASQGS